MGGNGDCGNKRLGSDTVRLSTKARARVTRKGATDFDMEYGLRCIGSGLGSVKLCVGW